MKKRPGTLRDSMVLLESSAVSTPPAVTSAFRSLRSRRGGWTKRAIPFRRRRERCWSRLLADGIGASVRLGGWGGIRRGLFRLRLRCACQLREFFEWHHGRALDRFAMLRLLSNSLRLARLRGRLGLGG